jgi:tetratricopeptide (TPR) repeat protein
MRDAARFATGSTLVNYQLAHEMVSLGRPREALELLQTIEPERGELRGWFGYWQVLTAAHHLVGNHRPELREAQRARSLYPDDPRAVIVQLKALAALGRTRQIDELLDEAVAMPARKEPNPGALMLHTALELRAHAAGRQAPGRQAAADAILARAIAWYQSRPAEQQSVRERYETTMALAAAGKRTEAREALELLMNTPPAQPPGPSPFASSRSPNYPDEVAYHGSLGVLAALDADTAAAANALRWLEEFRGPYARGRHTYWRAAITAAQGQHEEAIALLRQAFREGIAWSLALHNAPELASLRDYAPFRSLMSTSR